MRTRLLNQTKSTPSRRVRQQVTNLIIGGSLPIRAVRNLNQIVSYSSWNKWSVFGQEQHRYVHLLHSL